MVRHDEACCVRSDSHEHEADQRGCFHVETMSAIAFEQLTERDFTVFGPGQVDLGPADVDTGTDHLQCPPSRCGDKSRAQARMTINQGLRGAAQARRLHPTPELEGQLHHVRVDFGFVELGVEEHPRLQR